MTFTEQDAENNGKIKREAGQQMKSVAARESPELYQHFERVADARGRTVEDILGERVVQALEDEAYAERLFSTQVNMMEIQKNNIRTDDIEFVQELAESLGLNEEEQTDPIEELVMDRIQASASTPLSGFSDSLEKSRETGEIKSYLKSTNERLQKLEEKLEGGGGSGGGNSNKEEGTRSEEKSVDDLFGKQEDDEVVEEQSEGDVEVLDIDSGDGQDGGDNESLNGPEVRQESEELDSEQEVFGSEMMEEE